MQLFAQVHGKDLPEASELHQVPYFKKYADKTWTGAMATWVLTYFLKYGTLMQLFAQVHGQDLPESSELHQVPYFKKYANKT